MDDIEQWLDVDDVSDTFLDLWLGAMQEYNSSDSD